MIFSKFIFIVAVVLVTYYAIIVLYDLIVTKTRNAPQLASAHTVRFDNEVTTVQVDDESMRANWNDKSAPTNFASGGNSSYAPIPSVTADDKLSNTIREEKKNILSDLGLETLSGESYELSPENLSKCIAR